MTGEIAVRAYITATGEDKLVPHRRCLSGAVLEQEPAARFEVLRRIAGDLAQAAAVRHELVLAGCRYVRSHRDLAGHERITEGQYDPL